MRGLFASAIFPNATYENTLEDCEEFLEGLEMHESSAGNSKIFGSFQKSISTSIYCENARGNAGSVMDPASRRLNCG